MSSLKSGAMLSLFSGFSFESVQRAAQARETASFDHYPSPAKADDDAVAKPSASGRDNRTYPAWNAVAHATRFAPHILLRGPFGSN